MDPSPDNVSHVKNSDHHHSAAEHLHPEQVILKIHDEADHNADGKVVATVQFRTDVAEVRRIGQVLNKEVSLNVGEIEELESNPSTKTENEANEVKASVKTSNEIQSDRISSSSSEEEDDDPDRNDNISGQLRRRSSNVSPVASVKVSKGKSILRTKSRLADPSKSRLADPPLLEGRSPYRVNKSGQVKSGQGSGMLEKAPDEDDDDTLNDEDLPEHFRKWKFDALTLLQYSSLVIILAALVCTLVISKWKRIELRGLQLWKWEVLVLVLICGRLVSGWVIRILVFCIERNFMLRKRVVYFVYALRQAVQNCVWLSLVLVAWKCLFDKKVDGANNKFLWFVNRLLWCLVAATLIWLVKTLMVKVLASSFHVKKFFDRIQDTLFNQYLIEVLSGPPVIEIQNNVEEEEKLMVEISKFEDTGAVLPPELKAAAFQSSECNERGQTNETTGLSVKDELKTNKKQEEMMLFSQLPKMNPKNISAWNMKRLVKLVRHGALTTLDEHLQGVSNKETSSKQIGSEYEAKIAARNIFQNVAGRKSKHIYMDNLCCFLRDDDAIKAMAIIEGTPGSNKIRKKDFMNWVVNVFRERKALALTLNDTKTAVNKLHHMVNVLVSIIIVIICLIILGLTSRQLLVAVSSQFVVVTFIFGNTCKTIFEAIIFVFVMHPFDVGDRCEIGGVQMTVEEMNILTTVFLRFDSQKIIYPNSTLSTIPIHNLYRSPDMDDAIEFFFHIATPSEKISTMKQRIVSYIDNKKDHWYSNPVLVMRDMVELNKIKMSLWPTHKMNHQNAVERYKRRGLLVEEIVKIVKELDMEYRLYPIPINIKNMPIVNSTWTSSPAPGT